LVALVVLVAVAALVVVVALVAVVAVAALVVVVAVVAVGLRSLLMPESRKVAAGAGRTPDMPALQVA